MAQAKVTEFFGQRKRNADFQPSKRRKVARTIEPESTVQQEPFVSPPVAARTRRGACKIVAPNLNVPAATKGKAVRQRASKQTTKKSSKDVNQDDVIEGSAIDEERLTKDAPLHTPEILSEASAACDDHQAPTTPTKRTSASGEKVMPKRIRNAKAVRKDILKELEKTPEAFDFTRFAENEKTKSTRKKLVMSRNLEKEESAVPMPESLSPKQKTVKNPVQEQEETKDSVKQVEKPKEKAQPSKSKAKLDPATLRAQLSKTGKLAELQEKLAEYSQSVKKVKEARNKALLEEAKEEKDRVEAEAEKEKEKTLKLKPKAVKALPKETAASSSKDTTTAAPKAPAYERYHHLAQPVPPSLALPRKYALLDDMFRSADTVVSMLYKRSETCTFSKLRAAVQKMVSKNFEESHLGQIQTVFPTAYSLKQERGLPTHGYHDTNKSEYQLTLEPILQTEGSKFDKEGRPAFTAEQMTKRKNLFHRSLMAIVKKFHKDFISSLDRPLTVSDDQLTRWHPRFKLDEVPDVDAAELPKPPAVKKLTTAKEVLEEAKGKLNPRIRKALELIGSPQKEKGEQEKQENSTEKKENKEKKEESKGQLKGVSSSLLDRIRAKECRQQEAAMIQSPAQEKRMTMMQRLPELCKILRNHFVTQKKPALVLEDIVSKLSQSYRTNISLVDTEKHLELMMELVPDWIQILKIKRGSFVKIDKNKDVNAIIEKIETIRKKAIK